MKPMPCEHRGSRASASDAAEARASRGVPWTTRTRRLGLHDPADVALVCDTGPLLALLDADDPHHEACVAMVEEVAEDILIPAPVLVELDYWVRKALDVAIWQMFVEDVVRGAYRVLATTSADLLRAAHLEDQYASLRLGFVDAAVIAQCERLGETRVATLDRRHFGVVRPAHCETLTLLPSAR
ncbi:MAG: PIN domain-containing protein [Actinobacteria bacterium]|nr:PIN domain-containing protein [Actinomycetota bacterium]